MVARKMLIWSRSFSAERDNSASATERASRILRIRAAVQRDEYPLDDVFPIVVEIVIRRIREAEHRSNSGAKRI